MKVTKLEWDSHFFNKEIGVIEIVKEVDKYSDIERFDLLYVKQIEDKFIELDNFKLTYKETKVVFSKSISKSRNSVNSFIFSAFDTKVNKEQIYKLAYESGKFSRFNLDVDFQQHEFEALYKTWVDNSFKKEFADNILVYRENNVTLGFISYKIKDDYANVGLFAVCEELQGKGIGRKLLEAVENELSINKIKELRIPTQLQNIQACKFYKKLGYTISQKTIIKHFWKK